MGRLGKSSSRDTSGNDWEARDQCKKLGREIGPLPESGVGLNRHLPKVKLLLSQNFCEVVTKSSQ